MYLGKVKVTNAWQKLEDLIKGQIAGQSSFAFETGKTYQLQGESDYGIRVCNASTKPTDLSLGELIRGTQTAQYEVESGAVLYVKTFQNNEAAGWVHISVVGEE